MFVIEQQNYASIKDIPYLINYSCVTPATPASLTEHIPLKDITLTEKYVFFKKNFFFFMPRERIAIWNHVLRFTIMENCFLHCNQFLLFYKVLLFGVNICIPGHNIKKFVNA